MDSVCLCRQLLKSQRASVRTNKVESRIQSAVEAPHTSALSCTPHPLEKKRKTPSKRNSQRQNGPRNKQSYSSGTRNLQTGGYRLRPDPRRSSDSSQTESQTGGSENLTVRPTAEGVFESPTGISILGERIVNGKPKIIWGEDRRDLPWA